MHNSEWSKRDVIGTTNSFFLMIKIVLLFANGNFSFDSYQIYLPHQMTSNKFNGTSIRSCTYTRMDIEHGHGYDAHE